MLKKKNIFMAILSFVFCFSIFAGNMMISDVGNRNVVEASASMPETFEENESGENWSFAEDTLFINGIEWTETLEIPEVFIDLTIVISGENVIEVNDDNAIFFYGSEPSLHIMGSGLLRLKSNKAIISAYDGEVTLTVGDEVVVENVVDGSEISELSSVSALSEVDFLAGMAETHSHSFDEYVASGSELSSTCKNADCDLTDSKISTNLVVEDVEYGDTVNYSLELTSFNTTTGLSLSENDFSFSYYKVDSLGVTTGGELVDGAPTDVGYYYLKAVSSAESAIGEKELTASFEVMKQTGSIVSTNQSIKYDGLTFDVSTMFTFGDNAGTKTYSLITTGLESETDIATGTLSENLLTITKCGKINVKVETSGNDYVAGAQAIATLTIERADLDIGSEEGQIYIIIPSIGADGKEYDVLGWWERRNETELEQYPQVEPELRNQPEDCGYEISYWLDENLTQPTTTANGASAERGMPTKMGRYYIKAEIEQSDLYNSAVVSRSCIIKKYIDCDTNSDMLALNYKNIVNGEYDLEKLFVVDESFNEGIERIEYSYRVFKKTSETQNTIIIQDTILPDGKITINSISDEEEIWYHFGIRIIAKEDSLYLDGSMGVDVLALKEEIDLSDWYIDSKDYDGTPCEFVEGTNPFDSDYSIQYFLDLECTRPVTENGGVPINVGEYYVKVVVDATAYTKETTGIWEFLIYIKAVEIVWPEDNFVYNGQVQEIQAYYLDANGDQVALNVDIDKEFKNVQIDGVDYTYTATAEFANGETNYVLSGEKIKNYQIKPMKIEVEILQGFDYYGRVRLELQSILTTGEVFEGDEPFFLKIADDVVMNNETPVGKYEIQAELTNDTNYDVTISNTNYYYIKNIIKTNDMIQDWVYGQTASTPFAEDATGRTVNFEYYADAERQTKLDSRPEMPGTYYLYAWVEDKQSLYFTDMMEVFIVDKIEVKLPQRDMTTYTYNHLRQTYKLVDTDATNAELYTVGETSFIDAGTHKIQLIIKDFEIYRWENGEQIYEFDFVINKKSVEKPEKDNRKFKYNGNPLTYVVGASSDYIVSNNVTQTNVGRYKITISLADVNNTMWSDGTSNNLEYEFVINKNQITDATIVNADGDSLSTKDVSITNISGGGLSPETELEVRVLDSKDEDELKIIRTKLESVLKKYDKIFKVADVSLLKNGDVVQPENNITLKMLVPEELRNANFRLYHIHIDGNGKEVILEIDYSGVDENGYIVFQTDKLSSFAFVYEQSSLVLMVVIFAILTLVMIALLILQIVWFRKLKGVAKAVMASAVPVFYVAGELASTIALGIVAGLLLIANIVLLVINLKIKNQQKSNSEVKKVNKKKTLKTKK